MEEDVQFYYSYGIASSTQRAYKSAQSRYTSFCVQFQVQPLPLSKPVLCSFVSFLANQNLKFQTIKCYLSGIRYMQISNGFCDPFANSPFVKLDYVLKGIRRCQACCGYGSSRQRFPITPEILRAIRALWKVNWDSKMLWAAFCLGFFGFLRAGEFTVPEGAYDSGCHLPFNDIAVDSHHSPSRLQVTLKASKTDPFRRGIDLIIGKSGDDLCPVAAMLSYLAAVLAQVPCSSSLMVITSPETGWCVSVLAAAKIDMSQYWAIVSELEQPPLLHELVLRTHKNYGKMGVSRLPQIH